MPYLSCSWQPTIWRTIRHRHAAALSHRQGAPRRRRWAAALPFQRSRRRGALRTARTGHVWSLSRPARLGRRDGLHRTVRTKPRAPYSRRATRHPPCRTPGRASRHGGDGRSGDHVRRGRRRRDPGSARAGPASRRTSRVRRPRQRRRGLVRQASPPLSQRRRAATEELPTETRATDHTCSAPGTLSRTAHDEFVDTVARRCVTVETMRWSVVHCRGVTVHSP